MIQHKDHTMRYKVEEFEKLHPNNSHRMIIDFLGDLSPVLDVGCSTGFLGKYLKSRNVRAVGIEIDPVAAEQARPYYDSVIIGDIQSSEMLSQLQDGAFAAIVLGDVIEHLTEPWLFLKDIVKKAAERASIIISIPNLGHASVIASLLSGDFEYQEMGLLDRTHVRFFGIKSLCALILDAGLTPIGLKRVTYDAFATEIPIHMGNLPPELIPLLDRCTESHTYQFVINTIKAEPTETLEDYVKRFSLPGYEPSSGELELANYLEQLEKTRRELRDARQIIDQVASERSSLEETANELKSSLDRERSAREIAENLFSIHGKNLENQIAIRIREHIEVRLKDIHRELAVRGKSSEVGFGCDIPYDILIPIYNAYDHVKNCVGSVLKHSDPLHQVYLLDDASTDERILPLLRSYEEKSQRVHVITSDKNIGFIHNINRGFGISRNDVVILNSDTEVTPLWLERMHRCRKSGPGVGVVSPLSNNATILSVPVMNAPNPLPKDMDPESFSKLVADCSMRAYRRIPTAVGFCMLISRIVLDDVGMFDTEFGLGYGEECDFCMRARQKGYEIVCCDDAYVHHYGEASFISVDRIGERRKKNQQILHERWPRYHSDTLNFCRVNPLRDVQERVYQAIVGRKKAQRPSVLHVIHNFNAPGGTELHTRNIIDGLSDRYHSTVLYPFSQPHLWSDMSSESPEEHLRIVKLVKENSMAKEYFIGFAGDLNSPMIEDNFARFLSGGNYEIVHFQHLVDWATLTLPLIAKSLGMKIAISLHDYYLLCPEYNLLLPGMHSRCGKDLADWNDPECLYCLGAKRVSTKRAPETLNKYLAERAEIIKKALAAADVLVSPSAFVKNALIKAFGTTIEQKCVVIRHGVEPLPKSPRPQRTKVLRIGFLGNATFRKGILVFMNAARILKGMPVRFEIFGGVSHEIGKTLVDLGIVVHGNYQRKDLPRLLRKVDLVAIPSIWDETFCLTVSEAHAMGVPVIASDVGAISERVLDGVTGFLVPPGDPAALAKRLLSLAKDSRSLNGVITNLSVHVEKTVEENADDYAKVYSYLLHGSPLHDSNAIETLHEQHMFKQTTAQRNTVSMVVLTFNQLKYTKECVESIRKYTVEPHEIIFVDNGSTDGTGKCLRQLVEQNPQYKLIENGKNLGFSKGCNQGMAAASGEYILLLNNDVIVTENWLSGMLECLHSTPDIGIVGPMTNNISGPQKIEAFDYTSMAQMEEFAIDFRGRNRHRRVPVRRIVGFCMLFRRKLVDEIGLLDESFGSGNFEDDDYCLRASLAGYRNLIAGDVFIHHYGSRSFIGNKIDFNSAMARNKRIFNEKWDGIDISSTTGRKLIALNAIEKATEFSHKQQLEKAILVLTDAIKYAPEDKDIYYRLAEILIDAKLFREALEALQALAEGSEDEARYLGLMGYCHEGLDADDEAGSYADRVLYLHNASAAALNLKGILAYKKGDKVLAEDFFRKSISADPSYGEPYTNLGVLAWSVGQKDEALGFLEKGFVLLPTSNDIINLYHKAITDTGQFERAERLFFEAKTIYPHNQRIIFLLIDILIQQQRYPEALHEIQHAMLTFGIDDGIIAAALEVGSKVDAREIDRKPTRKVTLSLAMIVKNEQEQIARCLWSVKPIVDEIIVVDTGSTDNTKDIAKAFGANVYDFKWNNDFSEARNYALSLATCDWILILDADEVISSADYGVLTNLINTKSPKPVAYKLITRNYTTRLNVDRWNVNDGKYAIEEAGSGWYPSAKVRLFQRDQRIRFVKPIHECVEPTILEAGLQIKPCSIPIHHYGRIGSREKLQAKREAYYFLSKKKVEERGDDQQAIYELALVAGELEKFDEAIELWERFIQLDPNMPSEFIHSAYINMGSVYAKVGRYQDALNASKQVLNLNPELKEAVVNHANCMIWLDDSEKVISPLEDLLQRVPDYIPALCVLAVAYTVCCDEAKGRECLERLRKRGFDTASYLVDQATILYSLKRIEYAKALFEAALRIRDDEEARRLLEECRKPSGDISDDRPQG